MTQEDALERGMVPTAPIVTVIRQQGMEEDANAYDERIWFRFTEEAEYVEFDSADRLMCALALQGQWTRGELAEVYYAVNLTGKPRNVGKMRYCLSEGCANRFRPKRKNHLFCSQRCQKTHWQRVREESRSIQSIKYDTCPHGHDRSEENVAYTKDGRLYCRACKTEKSRAKRTYDPHPCACGCGEMTTNRLFVRNHHRRRSARTMAEAAA